MGRDPAVTALLEEMVQQECTPSLLTQEYLTCYLKLSSYIEHTVYTSSISMTVLSRWHKTKLQQFRLAFLMWFCEITVLIS